MDFKFEHKFHTFFCNMVTLKYTFYYVILNMISYCLI